MNDKLTPFPSATPARPDAAIYMAPDDVSGDPKLTVAEKRAILASWVSDARAVGDAPTLRRLDSGAIVEVASILDALRKLDGPSGVVVRLPARAARRRDFGDDDPPPTPAKARIPVPPIWVDAYGGSRRAVGAAV